MLCPVEGNHDTRMGYTFIALSVDHSSSGQGSQLKREEEAGSQHTLFGFEMLVYHDGALTGLWTENP